MMKLELVFPCSITFGGTELSADLSDFPDNLFYRSSAENLSVEMQVFFQAELLLRAVPGPEFVKISSTYEENPELACLSLADSTTLLDELLGIDCCRASAYDADWKDLVMHGFAPAVSVERGNIILLVCELPESVHFGETTLGDAIASSPLVYSGSMRGHRVELSLIPVYRTITSMDWGDGREARFASIYSDSALDALSSLPLCGNSIGIASVAFPFAPEPRVE